MRYSLTGGYQSNGENVSGINYCYSESDNVRGIGLIKAEIREAMDGLMSSPGHRGNILRPWHGKVNIGLAWDLYNVRIVQHFEGDHVEYDAYPLIEDGILALSGTVKNGVLLPTLGDLGVQVYYDPPPHRLASGQVARTYCYDSGRPVASLRLPLTGNSYYPDDEFTSTESPCPNPYEVPSGALPPRSPEEAHGLWQQSYDTSQSRLESTVTVRWVTASEWHVKDTSFSVKADLSDVLAVHGPGVYTIIVWGIIGGESAVVSEYSIFHGVTPPDTYGPYAPRELLTDTPTPSPSPTPTAATATTSTALLPQTPTTTATPSSTPTATVAPSLSPSATSTAVASPTPVPISTQTPGYTTKHGSVLPLIVASVLEDSITSLINDVRLTNNVESLIREPGLDNFAEAHSRLMADSKRLDAKALEESCGRSATQVLHWPQVKSFSYTGSETSPDSATPTKYDETAEQAASGIVEYMHEGVSPYTKSPDYRYIGVGVAHSFDELGFMEFWITFYLTDCMVEAPMATSTPTATATLSPTPTATSDPSLEPAATSTLVATSTPVTTVTPSPSPTATTTPLSFPTATSTLSPTPTATSVPSLEPTATSTLMATSTPTATASPTPTAASFTLRGFTNGLWLEQQDPQLASSIKELDWVQDGVDGTESKAIQDLLYIAVTSRPVASSIVSLGWIQDGIDDIEVRTIENLLPIANRDAEVASSIVSLSWVQDGIDAVEVEAIENVSYITIDDADVASSVVSLGWVQDGIDAAEVMAIKNLSFVAYRDVEIASSIVSLGWVQDGIEDAEVDLIGDFASIAGKDAGAALRIAGMPFVETIEAPDISAIEALSRLAAVMPETFVRVLSHPALLDGISNDIAPVIATLHGVAGRNPGNIDVLLDPSRVSLERRTITLPLAGDVVFVIIRTAPGAERSMDLLEHSVRGVEELMGVPLPTRYVGLLFEDTVPGSSPGANFGTHIAILAEFDVDDGSHEAKITGRALAHEVAHYYWSGNEDWVDEGAADFMASVIDGVRTGSPIGANNPPCGHAGNISELESLGIAQGDVEFGCNYSLGERLFVDLYRTLGEERFQRGFRTLYLASEVEDDADNRRDTSVGIEHIRDAFRSDDGAESAVIARWYDGTGPHDLSRLDTTPVDSSLSSINGRIDEAYIITTRDGPAVSTFSAQNVTDWVYLTLNYSYNVSGGPHEVPLEIVEFYEDGFKFGRRSHEITAEARFVGGGGLFPVGPPPWHKWAPGRYWVYVYAGDRKVAEVQYEVTP